MNLLKNKIGKTGAYSLYKKLFRKYPFPSLEYFLNEFSLRNKDVFFIQVGANDAKINDPLYPFVKRESWKGIMVEPQKYVFEEQLKKNYGNNSNIKLVNKAIDTIDGIKKLYKYSFTNARVATGLASFQKEHLISSLNTDYIRKNPALQGITIPEKIEDCITTEDVECITFKTLLSQNNIRKIDILMTDVEGYDIKILKTFPYELINPSIIIFESNLSFKDGSFEEEFLSYISLLRNYKYEIFIGHNDVIAFKYN